jgi:hypothetical protein
MTRILICAILLLTMLLSFGCGGGGGGSSAESFTKATISFSLISTTTLPCRLNGVEVRATLPTGLTVAASGKTITSGLEVGSAASVIAPSAYSIFSSYSAPNRIRITIADAGTGFGPGEMVRLTCSVAPGTTNISESDKLALENAITFKASGWDPAAASNPSSLNTYLKPKVAVTLKN